MHLTKEQGSFIASHAHNEILHVAATEGIIGVAAYFFMVGSLLVTFLKRKAFLLAGKPEITDLCLFFSAIAYLVQTQLAPWTTGTAFLFYTCLALLGIQPPKAELQTKKSKTARQRGELLLYSPFSHALFLFVCLLVLASLIFSVSPLAADYHYKQATKAMGNQLYEQAVKESQLAHRYNPFVDNYFFQIGEAQRLSGETSAAMDTFQEILRRNPYSVMAYNNLGGLFLSQGRIQEARVNLEKSVKLDPHSIEANYNLGVLFDESGEPNRALTFYKKVVSLDPQHSLAQEAIQAIDRLPVKR